MLNQSVQGFYQNVETWRVSFNEPGLVFSKYRSDPRVSAGTGPVNIMERKGKGDYGST